MKLEHVVSDFFDPCENTHTVSPHMDKAARVWLDWTSVVEATAVVEEMVTGVVFIIGRFQDIF